SYAHLEALVAFGPRPPGSSGAEAAADYLRTQLAAEGLAVREISETSGGTALGVEAPASILIAEIPGASDDVIVLFSPFGSESFDTFEFVGANDGASGAAVLLELASRFVADPLPYTTWIVFGVGDRDPEPGEDPASVVPASQLLVSDLERRGALSSVRLAVYLNQVGDRDLQISRDLFSDRSARRTFFREAKRLGFAEQFPANAPYDSLPGGHHAFWSAGMRRVVALSDPRFGGTEPPGIYWHTEEDTLEMCDAASLEAVTRVSEAGVRAVSSRFAKLDAWSQRPGRVAPKAPEAEKPIQASPIEPAGLPAATAAEPTTLPAATPPVSQRLSEPVETVLSPTEQWEEGP
ncbi:MAG: M28 family peptidase, partial [Myxococcota bacterium]